MKNSASLVGSLLVSAFIFFGGAAKAQENVEVKVLLENEKVRVYETRLKPGAESPSVERPFRVIRALTDGTVQRIYSDGKKETVKWKTGEVSARGPDKAYAVKNIGKSELVLYVVQLK